MDLEVEHIGIGDQPHVPSGTCARQIAVRGLDRTLTRAGRRLELQNANKRARRSEREILPRASAGCSRHIAPDLGALDAEFGEPRVEHGLLHRHGGAGVGDRRGMVERIDREVRSGETSLRQQRAEDEDRLIAALDALGDVDTRKETGACLADTLGCLVVGGRERTRRGRRGPRTLHGFAEREWRLRMRVRSGQDVSGQKDDDRSLRLTAVHLSHSLWNHFSPAVW